MRRRQAFTIVELMVSLALIIFIMVIMTEAFSAGMSTFRQLKAIGDMQDRLRAATTILRRDLSADHFEGNRKLSDPTFWNLPVREGFFRIVQGGSSVLDGIDPDLGGITSPPPVYATNHRLHFAVKLRGNNKKDYFAANLVYGSPLETLVNGGTVFGGNSGNNDGRFARFQTDPIVYHSAWAEVGYFLARASTDPQTPGDPEKSISPTPLFTLFRTQMVVLPDSSNFQNVNANVIDHEEFSCSHQNGTNLRFNSPMDLASSVSNRIFDPTLTYDPSVTFQANYSNPAAIRAATPLLTDVVSFSVRILKDDLDDTTPLTYFEDLTSGGQGDFDTTTTSPPMPLFVIKGLQITLRIWDARTEQTRQVTLIQDM